MKKLKFAQIELSQRTYGIPNTYLTTLSLGCLLNSLSSAFVHLCVHRTGARMRKPRINKAKGIAARKYITIIILNQVSVALTLAKINTKLMRELHDGWDPNLLPSIAAYKNQIKNTMTPKVCIKRKTKIWKFV